VRGCYFNSNWPQALQHSRYLSGFRGVKRQQERFIISRENLNLWMRLWAVMKFTGISRVKFAIELNLIFARYENFYFLLQTWNSFKIFMGWITPICLHFAILYRLIILNLIPVLIACFVAVSMMHYRVHDYLHHYLFWCSFCVGISIKV
jgi:hypothetical protein